MRGEYLPAPASKLSASPNESEVLFPPLTCMQPTGKMQVMQRCDASGITLVT